MDITPRKCAKIVTLRNHTTMSCSGSICTNVEFQISFKIKFQNRFSCREFMLAVNSPFSVRKPIPDTSTGT